MTQDDLAKAISQSPSSITMYETGRREPDFETLEALADVFNVPFVYFMTDLVEKEDPPELPQTPEARILSKGVDRLPPEERQQLLDMARVMFKHVFDDKEEEHGPEL